jgi:hypothetical protein
MWRRLPEANSLFVTADVYAGGATARGTRQSAHTSNAMACDGSHSNALKAACVKLATKRLLVKPLVWCGPTHYISPRMYDDFNIPGRDQDEAWRARTPLR